MGLKTVAEPMVSAFSVPPDFSTAATCGSAAGVARQLVRGGAAVRGFGIPASGQKSSAATSGIAAGPNGSAS